MIAKRNFGKKNRLIATTTNETNIKRSDSDSSKIPNEYLYNGIFPIHLTRKIIMMNSITKGYVTAQLNAQEFMKNQRGSIIEYVMVIALAGILITAAKEPLTTLVTELVDKAKTSVNP